MPPLWERLRDWLMDQPNMMATVDAAAAAMNVLPIDVTFACSLTGPHWLILETHDGVEHVALDGD